MCVCVYNCNKRKKTLILVHKHLSSFKQKKKNEYVRTHRMNQLQLIIQLFTKVNKNKN